MDKERKHIPIDLAVLRLDTLKPFDIYLRLNPGPNQYVLYSRRGTLFTAKVRDSLLSNNVTTIYVTEEERDLYQEYVEDNLCYIIRDEKVAPEKKSRIVYDSSKYLMAKLFQTPRADIIHRTRKTVDNIVDLILSDSLATNQLIRITEHDYYTYTHSVNVGVFSVAFARDLVKGLTEKQFHDLGLGFFLHDIGKSTVPIEVLNKKGPLSEDEWQLMKQHPEAGCKMLEQAGLFSRDTAQIVLQHHERIDGSGYPHRLRGDRINVFSKICSVADIFDAMTTRRSYKLECSAFDALTTIKEDVLQKEFDRDFFKKFVMLFAPGPLELGADHTTIS